MRRILGLVVLLLTLSAVLPGAPARAGAAGEEYAADRVLVVGVPGLVWEDLDPGGTPRLWALAENSPIGALSVRAATSPTCLLDGWGTLGAGNRVRFPGADEGIPPVPLPTVPLPEGEGVPTPAPGDPADGPVAPVPAIEPVLPHCELQEQVAAVGLADPPATLTRMADDEATRRFGAQPGLLGREVGCAGVIGRAASVAAAATGVEVTSRPGLPADDAELASVVSACPLTTVSLDELTGLVRPGDVDGTADPPDAAALAGARKEAVAAVDEAAGRLLDTVAGLPGDTLVLVVGVSEVNDGRARLHVAIASGPGLAGRTWLGSASTGRAPFVQLIDVAPTVLRALGLDVPASMNGQPVRSSGDRPALRRAVAELDRIGTAAVVHYRSAGTFFWILVLVGAAVVVLGMRVLGGWQDCWPGTWLVRLRTALRRARSADGSEAGRPSGRAREGTAAGALRAVSLIAAALPTATYLAGLVPWERAGTPVMALGLTVLAVDVLLAGCAGLGPWRRRPLGPPVALLAITLATLVGDVVTGSHLELDGLLGYDAIVAGRFTGYGNLTFGLLSVSALLLTAVLAEAAGRRADPRRRRAVTGGAALAAGLLTVGVIGAPGLGRDFGGVLAALPGFLLLAMLLTGTRVTVTRLIAVLGAAVVAVGAVAVLDWRRPAAERSHLGRFVEQVLTGEAWTVVSRKALANLDILVGSPLSRTLLVALVAAIWLVRPAGLLRAGAPRDAVVRSLPDADRRVLRAGLLAIALSLTVGAAANDSGVALPATAATLLVPLLVWLAAGSSRGGSGGQSGAGSDGGASRDRVTVVPRGSTVWNA